MCDRLTTKVWRLNVAAPVKYVLVAMAGLAKEDGSNVFPSVAYLAHICQISERMVQRHQRTLQDLGLIVPDGSVKGGRGLCNRWRIVVEKGEPLPQFVSGQSRDNGKGDTDDTLLANGEPDDTVSDEPSTSSVENGDTHDTHSQIKGDTGDTVYDEKGDIDAERVTSVSEKGDTHVTRSGSLDLGVKIPPSLRETPKGVARSEISPSADGSEVPAFSPPTLAQVHAYARETGQLAACAADFVDWCIEHEWRIGKQKTVMRDWQASFRRWCRRDPEINPKRYEAVPPPPDPGARQRSAAAASAQGEARDQAEREARRADEGIAALSPECRRALMDEAWQKTPKFLRDKDPECKKDTTRHCLQKEARKLFAIKYPAAPDWRSSSLPED